MPLPQQHIGVGLSNGIDEIANALFGDCTHELGYRLTIFERDDRRQGPDLFFRARRIAYPMESKRR